MQCVGVETFKLYNCEMFESSIHKWLLWISLSGVKSIYLNGRGTLMEVSESPMEVSESIFSCVSLTSLSLKHFKLTKVPPAFQGFSRLVTCYLEYVELSEKAFDVILKLCHLLESLTVSECKLPSSLRIISSSLKFLALVRLWGKICSIDCPRLESIEIIQCTNLVMENICLPACVYLETDSPFRKHFTTAKSLKKITCFDYVDSTDLEILQSFPHLEELSIESALFVSYQMDAELTLQLPNLKTFILNIVSYDIVCDERDEKYDEAFMLCSCILKASPLLQTVRINVDCSSEMLEPHGLDDAFQFINDFLNLAKDFPKSKILVSR
ncbi:hypothetical protein SUGI_0346500 [Cryptomeria japonica]|nr:hypothetical protein SUGI_0346500 [Cryptomeria japonica]